MECLILFQFLMVTYHFVVDMCLNWQIPIGGSTCLCATKFDLISSFKWFGCYKIRTYLVLMEFEIDTLPSSLLDPSWVQVVKQRNCLELGARSQLSALKGIEGCAEAPGWD
jgi:hypothetical protein